MIAIAIAVPLRDKLPEKCRVTRVVLHCFVVARIVARIVARSRISQRITATGSAIALQ